MVASAVADCRLLIKYAAQPDASDEHDDEKGLQLTQFEMAQLANLAVSEVDEARTLIPTYVAPATPADHAA